jgi:hypothetical protein
MRRKAVKTLKPPKGYQIPIPMCKAFLDNLGKVAKPAEPDGKAQSRRGRRPKQ